ncbi:10320_t:CDS:2, partial [Funneliformis geosporum]
LKYKGPSILTEDTDTLHVSCNTPRLTILSTSTSTLFHNHKIGIEKGPAPTGAIDELAWEMITSKANITSINELVIIDVISSVFIAYNQWPACTSSDNECLREPSTKEAVINT